MQEKLLAMVAHAIKVAVILRSSPIVCQPIVTSACAQAQASSQSINLLSHVLQHLIKNHADYEIGTEPQRPLRNEEELRRLIDFSEMNANWDHSASKEEQSEMIAKMQEREGARIEAARKKRFQA